MIYSYVDVLLICEWGGFNGVVTSSDAAGRGRLPIPGLEARSKHANANANTRSHGYQRGFIMRFVDIKPRIQQPNLTCKDQAESVVSILYPRVQGFNSLIPRFFYLPRSRLIPVGFDSSVMVGFISYYWWRFCDFPTSRLILKSRYLMDRNCRNRVEITAPKYAAERGDFMQIFTCIWYSYVHWSESMESSEQGMT
jgi:hypothetical protein